MDDTERTRHARDRVPGLLMNPVAAAQALGGPPWTAHWLRLNARRGNIPHTRGPRNMIMFSDNDLITIMQQRAVAPEPPSEDDGDRPTKRSRARQRRAA